MSIFGPPNIEKMKSKGDINGLIKALSYTKDSAICLSAVEALGEIGDPRAVEPLCSILPSYFSYAPKVELTSVIADALGKIGDARAAQPLSESLYAFAAESSHHNNCGPIVDALINALGKIGAPAIEPLCAKMNADNYIGSADAVAKALAKIGTSAVEPLCKALKGNNRHLSLVATEALGLIGDARAINSLTQVIYGSDESLSLNAIHALSKIGKPALESLCKAFEERVGWCDVTIRAIGKIGGRQNIELLCNALKDHDADVCGAAAEILGEIGDEQAFEPLLTLLAGREEKVRKAAAKALSQIKLSKDIDPSVNALIVVENQDWERTVSLGKVAVEPLCATLLKKADYGKESDYRRKAVEALGKIGDARAVEPLCKILKDSNTFLRADVATALGKLGDARAVRPLYLSILSDTEWSVEPAIWALGKIGGLSTVEALCDVLKKTNDARVVNHIAYELEKIGDVRAIESLVFIHTAISEIGSSFKYKNMGYGASDQTERAVAKALEKLGWKE